MNSWFITLLSMVAVVFSKNESFFSSFRIIRFPAFPFGAWISY